MELFRKAGYTIRVQDRSYYPEIDDPEMECMLLRPQEMGLYVEKGVIDAGLAGRDWVVECGADVVEVGELVYSKQTRRPARWVLAVPEDSPIRSVRDLEGKTIFTELVRTTRKYLERHGINAEVKFSYGATEVKAPHLGDAIVELTETGSSLRANRLRIIDTVMESVTVMIANRESWKDDWKRTKMENLLMLLKGALDADLKVGLKMNAPKERLDELLKLLPALRNPTISPLSEPGWVAVEVIVDKSVVREIIPELRRAGAEGIIEYPLNKVIP